MKYIGRVPAPPLDLFIDDIYCLTGVPRYRLMSVPPMPSAHLFVNLGEPARLWDSDPSVPSAVFTDAWFMGVWTRRFRYEYPARVRLVGVHFKPWGMSPFTGTPAAELRDRWVPADAVWQRSVDRIRNQLGETASAAETLRVLEEELRSRLAAAPPRGLDEDIDLDEVVATAGFFTVMDVLQVAVRSRARGAAVRIAAVPDRAWLRVEYTPAASGPDETDAWLAVEDRVRALDGTMQITGAGAAVIVEVELPCAS